MDNDILNFADTQEITCPSGLSGVVRNMTVAESRILAGKRKGAEMPLSKLVETCWVETRDPGPYTLKEGEVPWDEVLQGDRFYALLQIRILTYGADYGFSVACENRSCGERIDWSLSLADLPVRKLPDASREAFRAGNRFEAELPGERRAVFGLLTGADEARMAAAMSGPKGAQRGGDDDVFARLLGLRVREITGVQPLQKAAFLNRLSMRQARGLLTAFESADCGVDTEIEIACPHCGYPQRVDLPLGKDFLWPDGKLATASRTSA